MSDLLTQLKNDILELLSFEKSLYTEEELIDLLTKRNSDYTKEDILNTIIDLEDKFQIYRSKKKRYGLLSTFNLHIGKVELKKQGYGFFKFEESSEEDAFISRDDLDNALDNDTVLAFVNPINIDGQKKEARVVKVIKHNDNLICKVIHKFHNLDNKKLVCDTYPYVDIVVEDFGLAVVDDIVLLEVINVDLINKQEIKGRIKKIIGNKNQVGMDIKSICYQYNLEEDFSQKVYNNLQEVNEQYLLKKEEEKTKRRFVDRTIITIDGDDAKDFDDAVSVKKLKNGNYFLGVYIADVSYFVKEDSEIDKEAFDRGTSVYLLDRVIPMLPFKLCNDLCSLNEHEDKYVMALEMEINNNGEVVDSELFEAIINSKHRMTYNKVNKIISYLEHKKNKEESDEDYSDIFEYNDIFNMINDMNDLRKILNNMRNLRGSLNFEIPEAKIILDENGKVKDVGVRERNEAEKLIEEFMLIANETVASFITSLDLPFIYRVHDLPNSLKLEKFKRILKNTKYYLKSKGKTLSQRSLQSLLNEVSIEDSAISTMILRMMAKAKYSSQNIGHYGLASTCYTHFTSPIRRYPDLLVHRLIRKYIIESKDFYNQYDNNYEYQLSEKINNIALHSSEMEVNAANCEYEVRDMKIAEYMEDHIGEKYSARISSVTNFGMFVCIKNVIEGLIHIKDIEGDYYYYDEIKMALIGKRTSRKYKMGDTVEVICVNANKETKEIDFKLANNKTKFNDRKNNNSMIKYSKKNANSRGVKHGKKGRKKGHR